MTTPTTFNVGARVKYARSQLRMTQEALATAIGMNDRQTISDIENGKRSIKSSELLQISDALDQDIDFFLDPFNVAAETKYSWRASPDLDGGELDQFQKGANGWVGMARWLNQQEEVEKPESRYFGLRINEKCTFEYVQNRGEGIVKTLQLGDVPAQMLPQRLESNLGIPVLFVDVSANLPKNSISGAACRFDELSVILVNRRESSFRRNFDLAHALFHVLIWDVFPPEHRESNVIEHRARLQRVEQLANIFASAVLMPTSSLDHFIDPSRATDISHLVQVAEMLQVTTYALSWRLKNLGRIDESTRLKLEGLAQAERKEIPKLFSLDFVTKLHMALDKGRLSARKAAKTLGMSLFELTELFSAHEVPVPFEL